VVEGGVELGLEGLAAVGEVAGAAVSGIGEAAGSALGEVAGGCASAGCSWVLLFVLFAVFSGIALAGGW
jgi:hypothetical protein